MTETHGTALVLLLSFLVHLGNGIFFLNRSIEVLFFGFEIRGGGGGMNMANPVLVKTIGVDVDDC